VVLSGSKTVEPTLMPTNVGGALADIILRLRSN